ncbi:flagellar basal body P-ring formation chaperone FlgA [Marinobacter caseinilyticus]|uniref:flagellar basal body P-ring formation chaperone FlgA n=1 Tax=Marinobacter caseinilyticus TaxID=2692195 RepID=UPI0014076564|nr:flagellar basal body P-ring formation chaperone FlgA [Marinobacter caseinilyticus]
MRILILIGLATAAVSAWAGPSEEVAPGQVVQAATEFLDQFAKQRSAEGFKVRYELGSLDSRLTLAPCEKGPNVVFNGDPWRSTHPRLTVSCEGERPWKLYLSSLLTIEGDALVAARPLGRGDRIRDEMIATRKVVINEVRRGAITTRSELIGMEINRPINSDTVFTPDLVSAPDAVARGDHVIITAKSGSFSVQSRGKALNSGRIGDQVLIQNLASSRTVRAVIMAPGRVRIPM